MFPEVRLGKIGNRYGGHETFLLSSEQGEASGGFEVRKHDLICVVPPVVGMCGLQNGSGKGKNGATEPRYRLLQR